MLGSGPSTFGRFVLGTVLLGIVASLPAHASVISSNPSWLGPDRGLSQVGSIPTFHVPGSPGSVPANVTISNVDVVITNPTYVPMPLPGDAPLTTNAFFVTAASFSVQRGGLVSHYAASSRQFLGICVEWEYVPADGVAPAVENRVRGGFRVDDMAFDSDTDNSVLRVRTSTQWPSHGLVISQPLDPERYRISGFFELFLEVSLDNGVTWHEVPTPLHWEVVPSPGTAAVLALGGLMAARRRR